jgi:hypothetical protein
MEARKQHPPPLAPLCANWALIPLDAWNSSLPSPSLLPSQYTSCPVLLLRHRLSPPIRPRPSPPHSLKLALPGQQQTRQLTYTVLSERISKAKSRNSHIYPALAIEGEPFGATTRNCKSRKSAPAGNQLCNPQRCPLHHPSQRIDTQFRQISAGHLPQRLKTDRKVHCGPATVAARQSFERLLFFSGLTNHIPRPDHTSCERQL